MCIDVCARDNIFPIDCVVCGFAVDTNERIDCVQLGFPRFHTEDSCSVLTVCYYLVGTNLAPRRFFPL